MSLQTLLVQVSKATVVAELQPAVLDSQNSPDPSKTTPSPAAFNDRADAGPAGSSEPAPAPAFTPAGVSALVWKSVTKPIGPQQESAPAATSDSEQSKSYRQPNKGASPSKRELRPKSASTVHQRPLPIMPTCTSSLPLGPCYYQPEFKHLSRAPRQPRFSPTRLVRRIHNRDLSQTIDSRQHLPIDERESRLEAERDIGSQPFTSLDARLLPHKVANPDYYDRHEKDDADAWKHGIKIEPRVPQLSGLDVVGPTELPTPGPGAYETSTSSFSERGVTAFNQVAARGNLGFRDPKDVNDGALVTVPIAIVTV